MNALYKEEADHSASCIQKSSEIDWSFYPVIDEARSQDKPVGAAENQVYTKPPMSHFVREKQIVSSCLMKERTRSLDKPLRITEHQEEAEHSASCIQKSSEIDWSFYPVIDEARSQDKPVGAAENQEEAEHSASCIQKSSETDWSFYPVIDKARSQDKPVGVAENQDKGGGMNCHWVSEQQSHLQSSNGD